MRFGKRPLIGLPGRRKTGADIVGFPEAISEIPIDLYMTDYARGVFEAGGLPVHLPFDIDIDEMIELLDGLLMPGGTDIDPGLYGAAADPEMIEPESLRDDTELALLDAAARADLPVLGICRGVQLLNVHGEGTLHQHVPAHACWEASAPEPVHDVEFAEGSVARDLFGERTAVNSFHHQTIAEVSRRYVASGRSSDGTVEMIESTEHRWLGVQWHPEMMATRSEDPLFEWLVREARH